MSDGADLARRRAELIAQCDAQRDDLGMHVAGLATPIRVADRMLDVLACLRRHPLAVGATLAAVAVTQRRGILKWGQRSLLLWRAWRALRAGRKAF
jgi:hypothetical protein